MASFSSRFRNTSVGKNLEHGATMLEYCLLIILIILGLVASLVVIGGETSEIFSSAGTAFTPVN